MDGIRIKHKKALVNKLATAIGNSKDTQPVQHKSFMQQIDCVIDTVKTIKKTAEATTTTFCVKKIDKSICWQ